MKPYLYALLALAFAIAATGCGKCHDGVTQTIQVPVPAAPVPESLTQQLVDAENAYRLSLGQSMLSQGLSCTVQAVASGQWLSSSSPGYNAGQGVVSLTGTAYSYLLTHEINQPSATGNNSVLPDAIAPLFANLNYRVSCSGQLVVTETGYYLFDLNSDDGSILTVDGAQVVNNDGNHGMTEKQGTKLLRQGVHTFSLLYAQTGGGPTGIILQANGALIPGTAFYH